MVGCARLRRRKPAVILFAAATILLALSQFAAILDTLPEGLKRDVCHHARLERHAAAIDSRPDSVHLQPVSRLAWPPAAVVQRDVDRLDDRAARWQLHVRDSVRPRLFASGGGTAGRRQRSGASAGAGDGHRPFEPRRAPPARHLFPDRRAAGSRAALGTERGAAGTAARMAAQRPPCHHDAIRGERGHQAFGDDDRMAMVGGNGVGGSGRDRGLVTPYLRRPGFRRCGRMDPPLHRRGRAAVRAAASDYERRRRSLLRACATD